MTSLIERTSRFTFLLPNEDKRSPAVVAGIGEAPRSTRVFRPTSRGGERRADRLPVGPLL